MATSRWITVREICEDLDIARSTFDNWRAKGHGPRALRLPNGKLRVRRSDYERWLDERAADTIREAA